LSGKGNLCLNRNLCNKAFLNTYKSAERMHFDAAHELAHIILHHFDKKAIPEYEPDNRIKESEADKFASSFLMPTDAFLQNRPNYISLENMIEYKKYWGVSLAAINYKLHKLNQITDWTYRSNCVKINTLGYHQDEPQGRDYDQSLFFGKALKVLGEQPKFSLSKMLDEIRILESDFDELTFGALSAYKESIKPKLYLVHSKTDKQFA
ncbi:MAG TPA: ImmA/IrrE family metallo-endopeptidase, partial [Agitococcus sp.]|nr:ImmA/IrrE family metallo-endopeptidase [Agitococcus sp.]